MVNGPAGLLAGGPGNALLVNQLDGGPRGNGVRGLYESGSEDGGSAARDTGIGAEFSCTAPISVSSARSSARQNSQSASRLWLDCISWASSVNWLIKAISTNSKANRLRRES